MVITLTRKMMIIVFSSLAMLVLGVVGFIAIKHSMVDPFPGYWLESADAVEYILYPDYSFEIVYPNGSKTLPLHYEKINSNTINLHIDPTQKISVTASLSSDQNTLNVSATNNNRTDIVALKRSTPEEIQQAMAVAESKQQGQLMNGAPPSFTPEQIKRIFGGKHS